MYKALTRIRGGYRILRYINEIKMLFGESVRVTKLSDGSLIKLDLRSGTEWPTYYSKKYDDEILAFIAFLSRRLGGGVLDIGANIGLYSIRLARSIHSDQRIYSFEPVLANFERLEDNISINKLSNIEIFKLALTNESGELKIVLREDFKNGASTGNASIAISEEADSQFDYEIIDAITLDEFLINRSIESIGIIKIDVEGHEDLCFLGAKETLRKHRPIIFSEINNWYFEKRGVSPAEAFQKSLPEEYIVFKIREQGRVILEEISFFDISLLRNMHNVVFCPREKKEYLFELKEQALIA